MKLKILAVCCFLLVAGIVAWYAWPHWLLRSAAQDLNQLYAQYRPFPYRWTDAPFSSIQKENNSSCLAVPEEKLTAARLGIARAEKRSGETSRSLQLHGRIDLLYCTPEDAIPKYKLALLLAPGDPSLNLELGVAYALDADMDPQLERQGALEYEAALEAILSAGRQHQSQEFFFDAALLLEQAQLPNQALEQWEQAAEECSPEWRTENLNRLNKLRNRIESRQQNISELAGPPASFLSHNDPGNEGAELALDAAVKDWLPEMYDSSASRSALEQLSNTLQSDHHDRWLRDIMKVKQSEMAKDAFRSLASAVRSNIKGEHISAASFADRAKSLFDRSHSLAGSLRAQLEIVYSLDRRTKAKDCFAALQGLHSTAGIHGYTWIEAQAWLEKISCRTRTRTEDDVIKARREAFDWITNQTGYQGLSLRALGFMNEEYVSADSRLSLWRRGERGLRSFWRKPLPALRGYSLYLTLAQSAQAAGNRETAMALLRESALLMQEHGSTAIRALLLSYLGAWELEAKLNAQANTTFKEMEKEYKNINPSETADFRMQSEALKAEALISAGRSKEGLERLEQLTRGMSWPFESLIYNIRKPLLPAFGDAYLAENQLKHACDNYHQSIVENWHELHSVHDRTQRDNALREAERGWRGMTAVALRLHRRIEALTVWEAFRSSRSVDAVSGLPPIPGCSDTVSPNPPSVPENATALVYAFLPGGLSGWIVNRKGVVQHWIDEKRAKLLASRFTELVASSESPMLEISARGQELFGLLVKPFADNLPPDGTIVIDGDGVLASIPWSALEDQPGHQLVERFSFSQGLGLAEAFRRSDKVPTRFYRPLIFGPPLLVGELSRQYPTLPEASREAKELHRRLAYSVLLEREQATSSAFRRYAPQSTLFHFAGHGISYGGFGALLLAPLNGSDSSTQYMTANDIAGLDLSRLQLVVLAACSSGVGEQSGIVNLDSLTRAFLEAGASRVIAAGWDVDSSNTADLMSAFYDHLTANRNPAEALRQAQLRVRLSAPHPRQWAGFSLFGEP